MLSWVVKGEKKYLNEGLSLAPGGWCCCCWCHCWCVLESSSEATAEDELGQ